MTSLLIIMIICFLFYLLLPLLGAYGVYRRWSVFRRSLWNALAFAPFEGRGEGLVHFFGVLEAVEGETRLWLRHGLRSLCVDMERSNLYIIHQRDEEEFPLGEPPEALSWKRMFSLSQGTPFLVMGHVANYEGQWMMEAPAEGRLFAVVYEGKSQDLLEEGLRQSFHHRGYWNGITPWSLLAGSLFCFITAYFFQARGSAVFLSVLGAVAPLLPFLPPGVVLYFSHRRLAKKVKTMQIEKVLSQIGIEPPSPQKRRSLVFYILSAYLLLVTAVLVNLPVMLGLLRFFVF